MPDGIRSVGLPIPGPPRRAHVCSARQIRRAELLAHRRSVDGSVERDGVAVTTPIQMFIDIGLEVDAAWHLAIGDAMVGSRLLTTQDLLLAVDTRPAARGIAAARTTAALVRAGSESPMESLLRRSIVVAGLPEPAVNARVLDHGDWLARVDCPIPTSASPSSTTATSTDRTRGSGAATSGGRGRSSRPAGW